jgi:glycosyltransferase involved in cell wall biosynthesis
MRIVFDCRYTRLDGRHDGISRYTSGLVGELGKLHPVTMLISDHRQLALLPALPWELANAPTSIREPLVAFRVNRLKPDIVFSPMQTMGARGRKYRLLLTVHDLIYYRNRTPPRELAEPLRLLWRVYHLAWWPQRMLLNRADGVVTVSETTKALIAKHRLARGPVTVIPNAADDLPGGPVTNTAPATTRLVYMGSFMPYKNVETLIAGMAGLEEHTLHLLSRISPDRRAELERAVPAGASVVFHNGVSDDEYNRLLAEATALVTLSRAEGYGLPVIEAMAAGTPVIASDITIFREVGGSAALFVDPDDPRALTAAVRKLGDADRWRRASREGLAQASTYTWERSAHQLLEAAETAIKEHRSR